jgi:hypothetical protein
MIRYDAGIAVPTTVAHPSLFTSRCAQWLRPGGLLYAYLTHLYQMRLIPIALFKHVTYDDRGVSLVLAVNWRLGNGQLQGWRQPLEDSNSTEFLAAVAATLNGDHVIAHRGLPLDNLDPIWSPRHGAS